MNVNRIRDSCKYSVPISLTKRQRESEQNQQRISGAYQAISLRCKRQVWKNSEARDWTTFSFTFGAPQTHRVTLFLAPAATAHGRTQHPQPSISSIELCQRHEGPHAPRSAAVHIRSGCCGLVKRGYVCAVTCNSQSHSPVVEAASVPSCSPIARLRALHSSSPPACSQRRFPANHLPLLQIMKSSNSKPKSLPTMATM